MDEELSGVWVRLRVWLANRLLDLGLTRAALAVIPELEHDKPGTWGALMDELKIAFDGEDMFVSVDGVKVAKRGHPGTPHAKTWVPIEPGYIVRDCEDGIDVEFNGKTARVP